MNGEVPYGESVDDLFSQAAALGWRISKAQLHRWEKTGLLPKPTRRTHQLGCGSNVLYPVGTWRQLVALRKSLRENRSLNRTLWNLWWERYPIPEKHIRQLLERELYNINQLRQMALDGGLARGMKSARRTGSSTRIGPIPKGKFLTFLDMAVEYTDTARKVLGLDDNELRVISRALNPASLYECLDAASLQNFENAREEIRTLLDFKNEALTIVMTVAGGTIFEPVLYTITSFENLDLNMQVCILLMWLSMRTSETFSYRYTKLVQAWRVLRAGQSIISRLLRK